MKLFTSHLRSFPDPRHTLDEGIVDLSDDVRVERLLEAYSFGIFPWPHEDLPTLWFCPEERGVIDFQEFHVATSLAKFMRKNPYEISFNRAFDTVIEACAKVRRPLQRGTWITQRLLKAYKDFHRAGYAHSVEVWAGGELAGGLYGVYVGGGVLRRKHVSFARQCVEGRAGHLGRIFAQARLAVDGYSNGDAGTRSIRRKVYFARRFFAAT